MEYIESIKTAIIIFPLVAFLFTLPFIIHQYHKYGSINPFRVLIIYSFILYMMCIYLLIILPFPARNEVTKSMGEMINIRPFSFIQDIIKESSFVLKDPKTYLKALSEPCIYTVLFNIVMTIPFGMYLRYYFECSLKKTVLCSFLLSLFFELTQLTGLYFIYPGPYRLFDVDDLIMNTLGGLIGYLLMGLIRKLLPSRKEIDRESFKKGLQVSPLRRLTVFTLDIFLYFMISAFFRNDQTYKIIFIIYFIIFPLIFNDQTLAAKFLNVKLHYQKYRVIATSLRVFFIYAYYIGLPFLTMTFTRIVTERLTIGFLTPFFYVAALFIIFIFFLINFLMLIKNKKMFYDRIFDVQYESTIGVQTYEEDE